MADAPDPDPDPASPPAPPVVVWLLRHAATDWNEAHRFNGRTDTELSSSGREQARALAPTLAAHEFTSAWTSDLRRCTETATLAGIGSAIPDARLRELDFGRLEGCTWEQLDAPLQAQLLAFEGFEAPGGESVEALRTRVWSFLAELPAGDHLLVTHGGVIRLLLRGQGRDERPEHAALLRLELGAPPVDPG